jgi:DNA-directed RNA polymerase specialized sigma24 family protein
MLWEAFRKGDKEAFAALFRQHYETLFRYGSKFTNDTRLLEDSIHELFIEIWQSKSATPVLSIKAYLLKSLKYKLLKVFRQNGRMIPLMEDNDISFEWSHEQFLIDQQDSIERKIGVECPRAAVQPAKRDHLSQVLPEPELRRGQRDHEHQLPGRPESPLPGHQVPEIIAGRRHDIFYLTPIQLHLFPF